MPKELVTKEDYQNKVYELEERIKNLESIIEQFSDFQPKPLRRYSRNGYAAGGYKIFKYLPEGDPLLKSAEEKHDFIIDDEVIAGYVLVKKETNQGE